MNYVCFPDRDPEAAPGPYASRPPGRHVRLLSAARQIGVGGTPESNLMHVVRGRTRTAESANVHLMGLYGTTVEYAAEGRVTDILGLWDRQMGWRVTTLCACTVGFADTDAKRTAATGAANSCRTRLDCPTYRRAHNAPHGMGRHRPFCLGRQTRDGPLASGTGGLGAREAETVMQTGRLASPELDLAGVCQLLLNNLYAELTMGQCGIRPSGRGRERPCPQSEPRQRQRALEGRPRRYRSTGWRPRRRAATHEAW